MTQLDQVVHNMTLHPPKNVEVADRLDRVRQGFIGLVYDIDIEMPDGRDKALCFTKLEESLQHAIGAIVRNQEETS